MAERPVATASELARPELSGPELSGPELSGRSALLFTKLRPPGPRPDFLPRPRLAERLDEALRRGLVLVCAPVGYGKTSLLANWARHCQQPVAWLSWCERQRPGPLLALRWPPWTRIAQGSASRWAATQP
jgi:hypothetical protein